MGEQFFVETADSFPGVAPRDNAKNLWQRSVGNFATIVYGRGISFAGATLSVQGGEQGAGFLRCSRSQRVAGRFD